MLLQESRRALKGLALLDQSATQRNATRVDRVVGVARVDLCEIYRTPREAAAQRAAARSHDESVLFCHLGSLGVHSSAALSAQKHISHYVRRKNSSFNIAEFNRNARNRLVRFQFDKL